MATTSITLSESEIEHTNAKCVERPLDSLTLNHELPSSVMIKNINSQPARFLPGVRTNRAEYSVSPDIEAPITENISPQQNEYGHRLIPRLIDERAKIRCQDPVWSTPNSSNLADGFRDINYGQVARAVNRAAWWIDESIGKSTTFEALAYVGPPDLRYAILTVAAQKTGHTAFFSSHWNNTETHLHLLDSASCQYFITPATLPSAVISILAKRAMRVLVIPELDDLLYGQPVASYPYDKTFEVACHDPFVSCHTSGSTGFPKIVTTTHGTLAASDAFQDLPAKGYPPTSLEAMRGKRVLAGVPPFHAAGLWLRLAMPLFYDVTTVEGPLTPLTANVTNEIHKHGNVSISMLRPAVWEEIADKPEYLSQLSTLEYAMYIACAMPKDLGDKIATKTSVMTSIGCTEAMIYAIEYPDKEDWQYHPFSPCMGAEFRHHHEDLYELVAVRDPKFEKYQPIFLTFPEKKEYHFKDLYSPHPTKPNLWTYRGRADDVVVLMNGKKMHPVVMEDIVSSHPDISSALVIGQARWKPALLLEPKDTSSAPLAPSSSTEEEERTQQNLLLDRIWPTVERANRQYAEALRLTKDHVLFTKVGKPMVRTSKGSVQRMDTLAEYKREIDTFYDDVVGLEKAGGGSLVKDF